MSIDMIWVTMDWYSELLPTLHRYVLPMESVLSFRSPMMRRIYHNLVQELVQNFPMVDLSFFFSIVVNRMLANGTHVDWVMSMEREFSFAWNPSITASRCKIDHLPALYNCSPIGGNSEAPAKYLSVTSSQPKGYSRKRQVFVGCTYLLDQLSTFPRLSYIWWDALSVALWWCTLAIIDLLPVCNPILAAAAVE